jgi:hypothetical protein
MDEKSLVVDTSIRYEAPDTVVQFGEKEVVPMEVAVVAVGAEMPLTLKTPLQPKLEELY